MIIHFKYLVGRFIQFIEYPNRPDYKTLSLNQKLVDVGLYYLVFSVLLCVSIGSLVRLLKEFSFKAKEIKDVVLYLIFGAMIIAPLVEEVLFRLKLGYCRNKPYFKFFFIFLLCFLVGCTFLISSLPQLTMHIFQS